MVHIKYFAYHVCVRAGRSGNEATCTYKRVYDIIIPHTAQGQNTRAKPKGCMRLPHEGIIHTALVGVH